MYTIAGFRHTWRMATSHRDRVHYDQGQVGQVQGRAAEEACRRGRRQRREAP